MSHLRAASGEGSRSEKSLNLTDPNELRKLLERHGLTPQKRWGQHFLRSPNVVEAIVSRLEGFRGILEVGPGPGALTAPLTAFAEKLIALEVDPVAVSALSETAPKAEVRQVDVLKVDLISILNELPEPRAVVSNMPYNITGPLLTAFSQANSHYARAVLMMQKEVAERVLARPGDSNCGSLSIFLQLQFRIERVCSAPAGAFYPPPKVDSTVLQFEPIPTDVNAEDELRLFSIVRLGFSQPRKTLANNLSGHHGFTKDMLERFFEHSGLSPSVRPHQLTIPQWKALSADPLS